VEKRSDGELRREVTACSRGGAGGGGELSGGRAASASERVSRPRLAAAGG